MLLNVFVYGTLLPGEPNHRIVEPYLRETRPGAVVGRLYDVGAFPALVLDPAGRIIEGAWLSIDPAGLPALDDLEGFKAPGDPHNLYERVWVRDVLGKPEGFVYVFRDTRGLPEIPARFRSWPEWHRAKQATELVLDKALRIAEKAHRGQMDKAGRPYIEHPLAVMERVRQSGGGKVEQIVALLHDVLEDSDWTIEDISAELDDFPGKDKVLAALEAITKRPGEPYEAYLARVAENPIARRVKLADLEHNSDLFRIPDPKPEDISRVHRYREAIDFLSGRG